MNNIFEVDKREESIVDHTLWVEQHRPQKLEDYIGNDSLKKKIDNYIKTNDIPHLLFFGKAGTGKTTLAKLITKRIECDYLYVNASDENSVDNIRTKIKSFAASAGFKSTKIVVLDECDYLTPSAQAALRNMMETFSKHTRFILTCNYHERIIEPIISRCQTYAITPPNKKDVAVHLTKILGNEKVNFKPETVAFLVNAYYPDIRKIINTAQQSSIGGELKIDEESVVESDVKLKILEILKDPSKDKKTCFKEIRQLLADNQVSDFTEFYSLLYNKVDEYATGNVANVILVLAEAQYQESMVVDKEISFVACILQVLNIIKK